MTTNEPRESRLLSASLIATILVLMILGQLMAKEGARGLARGLDGWVAAPFLIGAYVALFTRGALWILVLRKMALTLAYPIISLSYVAILFASAAIFGESVSGLKILGSLVLVVGVAVLGASKLGARP